jgi:alkylhydroperoxidase family enzyme
MAWIKTIGVDEAEGLLAKIYQAKLEKSGRVSNLTRTMSLNPNTLRNMQGLYQAIMVNDSPLSKAQRCLLAMAVSRANGCHY